MEYYVYILTNRSRVLYVGVTNNIYRRVYEHKSHKISGFTARNNVDQLVYFEVTNGIGSALNREKQIEAWRHEKKIRLIESQNPEWRDLASDLMIMDVF